MTFKTYYYDYYNAYTEIEISNGYDGDTVELSPAAQPLTIDVPGASDIFTPSSGGGCEIRVLASDSDNLEQLFTYNAKEWKVTVKKDGLVVWNGWVSSEIYNEDFTRDTNYATTIQCHDGITALNYIDFVDGSGNPYNGVKTNGEILAIILNKIEYLRTVHLVHSLEWNQKGSSKSFLDGLSLNCANFYDEGGKPMKLREVLNSILEPYPLTSFIHGDTFCVLDYTLFGGNSYPSHQLYTITSNNLSYSTASNLHNNRKIQTDLKWIRKAQRKSLRPAYREVELRYNGYGYTTIEAKEWASEEAFKVRDEWVNGNDFIYPWWGGHYHFLAHRCLEKFSGVKDWEVENDGFWRTTVHNNSFEKINPNPLHLEAWDEVDTYARADLKINRNPAGKEVYGQVLSGDEIAGMGVGTPFGELYKLGIGRTFLKYHKRLNISGISRVRLNLKFKAYFSWSNIFYDTEDVKYWYRFYFDAPGAITIVCPAICIKVGGKYWDQYNRKWTTEKTVTYIRHLEQINEESNEGLLYQWLNFDTSLKNNIDLYGVNGKLEIEFLDRVLIAFNFHKSISTYDEFIIIGAVSIKDVSVTLKNIEGESVEPNDIEYKLTTLEVAQKQAPPTTLKVGDSSVQGLPTDRAGLLADDGSFAKRFGRGGVNSSQLELQYLHLRTKASQYEDTRVVLTGNLQFKKSGYFDKTKGANKLSVFTEPNLPGQKFVLLSGKYYDRDAALNATFLQVLENNNN